MQFLTVASIFALASAQVSTEEGVLTSCRADGVFRPTKIVLSPYPVVIGQPVTITSIGELGQDISDGASYKVQLRLGAVPVFNEAHNFCENSVTPCPLKAGTEATVTVTQQVPANAPAGIFNMFINVANGDGSEVSCIQGKIKLVKPSSMTLSTN